MYVASSGCTVCVRTGGRALQCFALYASAAVCAFPWDIISAFRQMWWNPTAGMWALKHGAFVFFTAVLGGARAPWDWSTSHAGPGFWSTCRGAGMWVYNHRKPQFVRALKKHRVQLLEGRVPRSPVLVSMLWLWCSGTDTPPNLSAWAKAIL